MLVQGTTYETGDVVSLLDRGGGIYYAVIRGFMQDQYAEKYAVLTWLLPRYPNPTHFDPADFILGEFETLNKSRNDLTGNLYAYVYTNSSDFPLKLENIITHLHYF